MFWCLRMKIVFLGTGGTLPTERRALPSIAVIIDNEVILMDAGEGTQRQLIRAHISPMKIKKILITHMHGDHVLGLPGLLQSMAMTGRSESIEIYGPPKITDYINSIEHTVRYKREYEILIKEFKSSGLIYRGNKYTIEAFTVEHDENSYGYKIIESDKPGKLRIDKILNMGLKPGPYLKKLKLGIAVEVEGKIIHPDEVIGPPRKGGSLVYSGDTRPCEKTIEMSKGADILIHDATFTSDKQELARKALHSTAAEAAKIALEAKVGLLVLFHISPRYRSTYMLLQDALKIYPLTIVSEDYMTLRVS